MSPPGDREDFSVDEPPRSLESGTRRGPMNHDDRAPIKPDIPFVVSLFGVA